jgi:polysaccharide export outer membrane protein
VKRKKVFISLALLFVFVGFLLGQEKETAEYKIGAKDLLDISVFGLKELNRTVRVSEEGNISLPLLGEIYVEGLTKTELEEKLSQLLEEKYLQNPQVTVFIKEYQSKRVFMLGAVEEPGPYELLGSQTLLQFISQAGGLTSDAGDEIIIIRQLHDGTNKSIRISIDDLILEGDTSLNISLEPNDIVNIPADKSVFIYVFGQVKKPGSLDVKKSNIPTLLRAIAQAGGFSDRASKSKVIIKRVDQNGEEIQIKVNVKEIIKGKRKDVQLKENDIVYVPETIF